MQLLVQQGYLRKEAKKSEYSSYDVFFINNHNAEARNVAVKITSAALRAAGEAAAAGQSGPLLTSKSVARERLGELPTVTLPVPEGVARAEAEAAAAADAKLEELRTAGVDVSAVPQSELDAGGERVRQTDRQRRSFHAFTFMRSRSFHVFTHTRAKPPARLDLT